MDLSINFVNGYEVIEYNNSNVYCIKNIFDDELCKKIMTIINTANLEKISYSEHNNVECYITTINELLDLDDMYQYVFSTDAVKYTQLLLDYKICNSIYTNKLNGISKRYTKYSCLTFRKNGSY